VWVWDYALAPSLGTLSEVECVCGVGDSDGDGVGGDGVGGDGAGGDSGGASDADADANAPISNLRTRFPECLALHRWHYFRPSFRLPRCPGCPESRSGSIPVL
jgi:hypothetical protein